MRRGARAALLVWIGIATAAAWAAPGTPALVTYLTQRPERQFFLPVGLSEISGLAAASEGTVYALAANYGIVYEVELESGKVIKAFALGKPTVKADFEDIAVRGDYVYLLTGDGRIFEAPKGENRKRVRYNVYDTGVGEHCETEGLVQGPSDDEFLILCKQARERAFENRLTIFIWSLREQTRAATPWLSVSLDGLVEASGRANFRPSTFAWRRDLDRLLIVSATDHTATEIDRRGSLIGRVTLDRRTHWKPQALALMPDGRLIVGDEGPHGRGRLAVYSVPQLRP